MKYFIIVIAILWAASTSVLGYFVMQQNKEITTVSGPSQPSNELTSIKSQIAQLQNELTELKKTLSNQSLLIQTLKSNPSTSSENPQPVYGELFKDPDFSKELQDRVEKVVKDAQRKQMAGIQKQIGEATKQFQEMGKQMLDDFVGELSKELNLDAYQQQELSKILGDRANKTLTLLFMQFSPQKVSPEEFKSRQEVIKNESNEKVKQILLPEQYEKYQKVESQFPEVGGGGWFKQIQRQQQQQTPQQEQTPQEPK